MPELLEDAKGTDMTATRYMFVVIAAVAILAAVVLVTLQLAC